MNGLLRAGLDGPSRTIIVEPRREPVTAPPKEPREPARAPEPKPRPKREPEKVPAGGGGVACRSPGPPRLGEKVLGFRQWTLGTPTTLPPYHDPTPGHLHMVRPRGPRGSDGRALAGRAEQRAGR